jgi:uncharacterized protein YfcZ (UPF0381/DUF406 family)
LEKDESGAPEDEERAPVQIEEAPISTEPLTDDNIDPNAEKSSEQNLGKIVDQENCEQHIENVEQSLENVEQSLENVEQSLENVEQSEVNLEQSASMLPSDLEEALKAAIGETVPEENPVNLEATESSDLRPMDTDI